MMKINFSQNLKLLRQKTCLTQTKLAELLGVDQRTVSAWENDVCEPCFEMLSRLCEIFDVDFNYILS